MFNIKKRAKKKTKVAGCTELCLDFTGEIIAELVHIFDMKNIIVYFGMVDKESKGCREIESSDIRYVIREKFKRKSETETYVGINFIANVGRIEYLLQCILEDELDILTLTSFADGQLLEKYFPNNEYWSCMRRMVTNGIAEVHIIIAVEEHVIHITYSKERYDEKQIQPRLEELFELL